MVICYLLPGDKDSMWVSIQVAAE